MNSDFITNDEQEFTVRGKKWAFKPVTAGQKNDWMTETLVYKKVQQPNGEDKLEIYEDPTTKNRCKIRNITRTPYSKEEIQDLLRLPEPKCYHELSNDQKWEFIGRLKEPIFAELLSSINEIQSAAEDDIKKSSEPSTKESKD